MKQISTSRTIASFRSTRSLSGCRTVEADRLRQAAGYAELLLSETRRCWLNAMSRDR